MRDWFRRYLAIGWSVHAWWRIPHLAMSFIGFDFEFVMDGFGEGLVQTHGGPHLTLNHPFWGVASTKSSRSLCSLVLLLIGVA